MQSTQKTSYIPQQPPYPNQQAPYPAQPPYTLQAPNSPQALYPTYQPVYSLPPSYDDAMATKYQEPIQGHTTAVGYSPGTANTPAQQYPIIIQQVAPTPRNNCRFPFIVLVVIFCAIFIGILFRIAGDIFD